MKKFPDFINKSYAPIAVLLLTQLSFGCGKGSGNTIRLSQKDENRMTRFSDAFVVDAPACRGHVRWGYLPEGAVEVLSISSYFLKQRRPVFLRSFTIEISEPKSASGSTSPETEDPGSRDRNSTGPLNTALNDKREFRLIEAALVAPPPNTVPFGESVSPNLTIETLAERANYQFSELCSSGKNIPFMNQKMKITRPTFLLPRGQFTHKLELSFDPSDPRSLPKSFPIEARTQQLFMTQKEAEELFFDQSRVYVTPKGFTLQYKRQRTQTFQLPDGVKEGDREAQRKKESQLTLTLLYEVDPDAPSDPLESSWTDEVIPKQ